MEGSGRSAFIGAIEDHIECLISTHCGHRPSLSLCLESQGQGTAMATAVRAIRLRREERLFFAVIALSMLAFTLHAFAPSYFLVPWHGAPEGALPFTWLVHLHAALFSTWCVLFLAQVGLVSSGKLRLHRQLGMLGVPLLAALVIVGPWTAIAGAQRGSGPPDVSQLSWLAVPLSSAVAYTLLIGSALLLRRDTQAHKRLMVLGMVVMLSAVFGRTGSLPGLWNHVIQPGVYVLALLAWDFRSRGKPHWVTGVIGPATLFWQWLPDKFWASTAWTRLAGWITGMPA